MKIALGILSLLYKLYVGVVFVAILLILYPFFLLVLSRKCWCKYSFPINVVWSWLMRIFMVVWVHRVKSVPMPKGPYMIIANHTSYLDIFLLYSLLPQHRFLFMGKGEILSYPLIKTFFKRLNIPVFRGDRLKAARSFIQAKTAVREGWSIVIFPEGGIPDHSPQMIPFKDGAFKLAKSEGIPIVPITFLDNYHLFSDPEHPLGYAHPGISRVYIHDIVTTEQVAALSEQELSALTYGVIAAPLIERGLMKAPGTENSGTDSLPNEAND